MNLLNFSPQYKAFTALRFQAHMMEDYAFHVLNQDSSDSLGLIKNFFPSESEKKLFLKDKSIFEKAHFYIVGQNAWANRKINEQIKREERIYQAFSNSLFPLQSTSKIHEELKELFHTKISILKDFVALNKLNLILKLSLGTIAATGLSYLGTRAFWDYQEHCNHNATDYNLVKYHEKLCPQSNPWDYLQSIGKEFLGLPIIVLLGAFIQAYDTEIISRITFSPVDKIKRSACNMLQKISKIKDFLLDYSIENSLSKTVLSEIKERIGSKVLR